MGHDNFKMRIDHTSMQLSLPLNQSVITFVLTLDRSIDPPLPKYLPDLPTFVTKSVTLTQSWISQNSRTWSLSKRASSLPSPRNSFLITFSSWACRPSSSTGLGIMNIALPVLSSILQGELMRRRVSSSLKTCSSQGLSLQHLAALAMVVMRECLPVSAFPTTRMFPPFVSFRAVMSSEVLCSFFLCSMLKQTTDSQFSLANLRLLARCERETVSTLVRTEITTTLFFWHCCRNCLSMQSWGLLASSISRTTETFWRVWSRLVMYFLMRLSLGLGRQAHLFSILMSPQSVWSRILSSIS